MTNSDHQPHPDIIASLRNGHPGVTTIKVIDAIMGKGKTTYLIDRIRQIDIEDQRRRFETDGEHVSTKFLVVVPLLSEVDRFHAALPDLHFKDPQPIHGRKLYHLSKLIEDGENVVTTHSLFRMLNRDIYAKLKGCNYVLVIDEVLDAVEMFTELTAADRKLLFENNMVSVEPASRRLMWNDKDYGDYVGKFEGIKALCDTGSLVMVRDSVLLWEFPSEFLRCFKEVWVATYMLYGSPFHSYLLAEGFHLDMKTVCGGRIVDWLEGSDEVHIKRRLRDLITIYDGQMNDIGKEGMKLHPLSKSWFDRQSKGVLAKLKSSTETFFRRVAKSPAHLNGWTTWKDHKTAMKGEGYSRNSSTPDKAFGFIPSNAKATNDYRRVGAMAYLANVFYHPIIKAHFEEMGVPVYEDLYAVSQMVQWMWRSRIRSGEPIHVFVPSERMRGLLKRWLATGSTIELVNETDPSNRFFTAMILPGRCSAPAQPLAIAAE
jgi:hypothetical protein